MKQVISQLKQTKNSKKMMNLGIRTFINMNASKEIKRINYSLDHPHKQLTLQLLMEISLHHLNLYTLIISYKIQLRLKLLPQRKSKIN